MNKARVTKYELKISPDSYQKLKKDIRLKNNHGQQIEKNGRAKASILTPPLFTIDSSNILLFFEHIQINSLNHT